MSSDYATKFIGQSVTVTIDRPLGSKHPEHDYYYPLNYGFIEGIVAPDGHFLDAYVLGVDETLNRFTGVCIAVIQRADDDDDKLIVVPDGLDLSDDDILDAAHFQEQWFDSSVVRN